MEKVKLIYQVPLLRNKNHLAQAACTDGSSASGYFAIRTEYGTGCANGAAADFGYPKMGCASGSGDISDGNYFENATSCAEGAGAGKTADHACATGTSPS